MDIQTTQELKRIGVLEYQLKLLKDIASIDIVLTTKHPQEEKIGSLSMKLKILEIIN